MWFRYFLQVHRQTLKIDPVQFFGGKLLLLFQYKIASIKLYRNTTVLFTYILHSVKRQQRFFFKGKILRSSSSCNTSTGGELVWKGACRSKSSGKNCTKLTIALVQNSASGRGNETRCRSGRESRPVIAIEA